ncbi:hypothetical protein CDAR_476921 [Caerostris darwini]|uniref:Uncharacterized protein n=1 Tax=Caerostris darwini TaxID=1538125 RepID=A0AAV4U552_9ARAC|nr:hypothetical protein CDAR_476921 [Caerostris darwini]
MPNPLPCSSSSRDDGDRSSEGCPTDFPYFISVPGWDPIRDRQRVGKLPDFHNGKKVTLPDVASSKGPSAYYSEDIVFKKGDFFSFKCRELSLNDSWRNVQGLMVASG